MKTIEQMIFERMWTGVEFDANDYNDWAKENEAEAYQICLLIAKQLLLDKEHLKLAIDKERRLLWSKAFYEGYHVKGDELKGISSMGKCEMLFNRYLTPEP